MSVASGKSRSGSLPREGTCGGRWVGGAEGAEDGEAGEHEEEEGVRWSCAHPNVRPIVC
jgi:hypothetical protein